MNRNEYMNQLAYKLRRLPKEDYDRAMSYFYEYFEDAGMENEQQAIDDLGSPQAAADQIIQDIAQENLKSNASPRTVKRGISTVWVVILAIFASPIALPLALAFIIVLVCLLFSALLIVISIIVVAISIFASSVLGIAGGIYVLFTSPINGLTILGFSILTLGISLLVGIAAVKAAKWFGRLLPKIMGKFMKGGKHHA